MMRFFNVWGTLALAMALALGGSYFAPIASAAVPEALMLKLTDGEKA